MFRVLRLIWLVVTVDPMPWGFNVNITRSRYLLCNLYVVYYGILDEVFIYTLCSPLFSPISRRADPCFTWRKYECWGLRIGTNVTVLKQYGLLISTKVRKHGLQNGQSYLSKILISQTRKMQLMKQIVIFSGCDTGQFANLRHCHRCNQGPASRWHRTTSRLLVILSNLIRW